MREPADATSPPTFADSGALAERRPLAPLAPGPEEPDVPDRAGRQIGMILLLAAGVIFWTGVVALVLYLRS